MAQMAAWADCAIHGPLVHDEVVGAEGSMMSCMTRGGSAEEDEDVSVVDVGGGGAGVVVVDIVRRGGDERVR